MTWRVAASAAEKKLPIFVIGKSAKPRCFENVKSLPCYYQSQVKSWMNSFIFDKWIKELDKKFGKKHRKVILIVYNCPRASNYWKFESCLACVPATKHNFKNPTYEPRCDIFHKRKMSQKNYWKTKVNILEKFYQK